MIWNQKELEVLYQKAIQKASKDKEFAAELARDLKSALEKLAGEAIPEGFSLKQIELDPRFSSTYVTPDFANDELDMNALRSVQGGNAEEKEDASIQSDEMETSDISLVLVAHFCAINTEAPTVIPDDGCSCLGVYGCPMDTNAPCSGNVCVMDACAVLACPADVCAADGGSFDICAALAGTSDT